jgi:aryl-alcohol dehydrogenase-like predicted oxidoreductase
MQPAPLAPMPQRAQPPQLALGTVQFGLAYGAVGSGQAVPPDQARAILDQAWQDGTRTLDTAATYGDIEARLAGLCGSHPFRIVSKIMPLGALPAGERPAALALSMQRSMDRLGERLHALLFHSAADLLAPDGPALWHAARALQRASGRPLRLGVSVYAPAELLQLRAMLDIDIAQLPGNALDQRLHALDAAALASLAGVALHLRSAFLQGLLLAPERAALRVPAAAAALGRWQAQCQQAELPLADAALGLAKGLPLVEQCVVGVESLAQWHDVAAAWQRSRPLHWPTLASDDPDAFDPRRWPPA